MPSEPDSEPSGRSILGWIALLGGPLGGLTAAGLLSTAQANGSIDPQPAALVAMAGVLVLMAVWWLTDAVPFAATALVPLALFPLFGILTPGKTAECYGDKNVFLYLGGFLVALAVEETGLHRRLALAIVDFVGDSPARVVLGFMLATGLLSMWLSNTATTMMMLPIALSILTTAEAGAAQPATVRNFGISLCLAVAYAASIGGIATPVGSPTNLIFFQNFERYAVAHPEWRELPLTETTPAVAPATGWQQSYSTDQENIGAIRIEAQARTPGSPFELQRVRLKVEPKPAVVQKTDAPSAIHVTFSLPKSAAKQLQFTEGAADDGWSIGGWTSELQTVTFVAKVSGKDFGFPQGTQATFAYNVVGRPADEVDVRLVLGTIRKVSFAEWTAMAVPLALVMLFLGWAMMVYWLFPLGSQSLLGGRDLIKQLRRDLGPLRPEEFRVGVVFGLTALLWILREPILSRIDKAWQPPVDDSTIAIGMALVCFLVPRRGISGQPLMSWEAASRVPWGILLLFGGGLALAAGLGSSGLDRFVGSGLGSVMRGMSPLGMTILAATGMTFFTEITSNVACTQMVLPILIGVCEDLQIDPLPLMLVATMSASFAFMLPVGTPPNAIVYGTGRMTIREMAKTGFWMNLLGITLVTLFVGVLRGMVVR